MIQPGTAFDSESDYDDAIEAHGEALLKQTLEYRALATPLEASGFRWRGLDAQRSGVFARPKEENRAGVVFLADDTGAEVAAEVITRDMPAGMLHAILPIEFFNQIHPPEGKHSGTGRTLVSANGEVGGVLLFTFTNRPGSDQYTHQSSVLMVPAHGAAEALRLSMMWESFAQSKKRAPERDALEKLKLLSMLAGIADEG